MDSAPQDFGSQILLVIIRQEVKSIENFFYICGHVYITSYLYKNYIRKLLFFVSKEGFLLDYILIQINRRWRCFPHSLSGLIVADPIYASNYEITSQIINICPFTRPTIASRIKINNNVIIRTLSVLHTSP